MKITIDMPDELIESVVKAIMENFPEADEGCVLQCNNWNYDRLTFRFTDEETGTVYILTKEKLMKTFPLLLSDKWGPGLTQPPISTDSAMWDSWLCQVDQNDLDAFVQLACFGEIIYE